ncbi:general transcription factor 3C polypeptide 6-like [Watersipora subatra]|uniref:general transcription factor 3C polypeptide 6-like n=1 Tax=Watersipora subatra TaxID=2589382 RepID=UPI00355C11EF
MTTSEEEDQWITDEETDVVVKLSGVIRDEFVKNLSASNEPNCSALGLSTDAPLLQLGADIFQGRYSDSCGTHLLLKDARSTGGEKELSFVTTTVKQMEMNKLYIQEKKSSDDSVIEISAEVDDAEAKTQEQHAD